LVTWCWLLTTILHDAVGTLVESLSCSLAVTGWQGLQKSRPRQVSCADRFVL
ncbi:hypothetical protein T4C_13387, partial [Trichinella pseudospiralis]